MFLVKLSVCICEGISEQKREDRFVLTDMCMCMYTLCPGIYEFFWATFLTVMYICGLSGVNLSCRNVPVCCSVGVSALNKKLGYSYLPTPLLVQDMTQGQFLSGVSQVWIQSFPSPGLVASPRLKTVCPTIYPLLEGE